ncbi:MAG: ATP-grasp domain-containing protein [Desulfobacteraceae bacterium]|nr:ATP-grasp domain-containing protein [Desulfobacteraceae bacterium]
MKPMPVAIGARLKKSTHILTLGFKPNFYDYSPTERDLILNAPKIYYPTSFYADLFNAMGKTTFPSYHTYKFAQDKIRQTAVFQMSGIPHPKTRIFYGKKQKKQIIDHFQWPFIAKKARGSSKGNDVFLIENQTDLDQYLEKPQPAYIQEYLPIDRDMRIIVIGRQVILSYWRIADPANFKTNLSQGGSIDFTPLPKPALELALETCKKCGWDDVGIDIIQKDDRFYVLEGNMKYGTKGFKKAGIDYKKLLEKLVLDQII